MDKCPDCGRPLPPDGRCYSCFPVFRPDVNKPVVRARRGRGHVGMPFILAIAVVVAIGFCYVLFVQPPVPHEEKVISGPSILLTSKDTGGWDKGTFSESTTYYQVKKCYTVMYEKHTDYGDYKLLIGVYLCNSTDEAVSQYTAEMNYLKSNYSAFDISIGNQSCEMYIQPICLIVLQQDDYIIEISGMNLTQTVVERYAKMQLDKAMAAKA